MPVVKMTLIGISCLMKPGITGMLIYFAKNGGYSRSKLMHKLMHMRQHTVVSLPQDLANW